MEYLSTIDGISGEVFLDELIAQRGPLIDKREMPEARILALTGKVPNLMIDFWRAYGLGHLQDGLIRLCDPAMFDDLLPDLFKGDADFTGDCHVLAFSPFGDLFFWSERHWLGVVSLPLSYVDAPFLHDPTLKTQASKVVLDILLKGDPRMFDTADAEGNPMFAAARKVHGPLDWHEVYGAMPLPVDAAELRVDRLVVAPAVAYLESKFSTTDFVLHDMAGQRFNIRFFGDRG